VETEFGGENSLLSTVEWGNGYPLFNSPENREAPD